MSSTSQLAPAGPPALPALRLRRGTVGSVLSGSLAGLQWHARFKLLGLHHSLLRALLVGAFEAEQQSCAPPAPVHALRHFVTLPRSSRLKMGLTLPVPAAHPGSLANLENLAHKSPLSA